MPPKSPSGQKKLGGFHSSKGKGQIMFSRYLLLSVFFILHPVQSFRARGFSRVVGFRLFGHWFKVS